MKTLRKLMILVTTVLLLGACVPKDGSAMPAAQSGQAGNDGKVTSISVSGAFALFPLMTVWAEAYQQLHPEIRFDVQAGGAGKGMTDMLTGAADIAMLSREPRPSEVEQGSFLVPAAIDAVVGTFNAANPHADQILAKGLTPQQANTIWISGQATTWDQWLGGGIGAGKSINVYTRSDASGAGEMWALYAGGQAQEELQGIAVNADPGVAEAVRQDPLGVGYNNIGFAYDLSTGAAIEGLQIIPLDLNANGQIDPDEDFYANRADLMQAIASDVYPFPPARVLYLVTKGAPSPQIADFYRWVLTDGQVYVAEAGYVSLTSTRLQKALTLLGDK